METLGKFSENKLKRFFAAVTLTCLAFSADATNLKLETNEMNCRKVVGYGADDKMAIAKEYKVALSSIRFLGAKWSEARYGSKSCIFFFDTPVGPKRCSSFHDLLSDDGGKTAFGVVSFFGNVNCWD
jgi:hypothetical protein